MTPNRYSKSAMALHWLIAALMAFQYGLGEAFAHMPRGKALFDVAQFHKSIGITILLLTLLRLGVRFWKPRPALHGDRSWAIWAAKLVHFGFYIVLLAVPLTGWLAVSTSRLDIPTLLFNTVPWPDFPFVKGMEDAARHGLHEWAEGAHEILSKLFVVLFLLHIIGALRHQLLLKDMMIERMLPLRRLTPVMGSVLIAALAGGAFALQQFGQVPGIAPAAIAPPPAVVPKAATAPPAAAAVEPVEAEADKAATEEDPEDEAKEADPDAIPPGETPRWTTAPGGRLGFATSWSGTAIDGNFGNWNADIRFNPDALPQSRIRVTIALASANSGDGERDSTLKGSDFFDTGSHPQATWTSSSIRHLGGDRYRADGTLSLRGVSKAVPITFTLAIDGKDARVSGNASLSRLAFGVGQGEFSGTGDLPDRVSVRFNFRARRP
jgi:cytochrome b561/polyisoprenoid-binding protein YceI